jgi:hypothetical protein
MDRRNFLKYFSIIATAIVAGKSTASAYFRQINPFKGKMLPGPAGVSLQDLKIDKHGRVIIRHPNADKRADDTTNPPADTQCGRLFADTDRPPQPPPTDPNC